MAVPTFTKSGAKATSAVKLDESVFGVVPTNHTLLKEAYVAYLANSRENLAVAKTRGDVSGGGKKPWRQKGTGRARFGSSRVPQWRHGGIVFGPTGEENYTKKLNVKAKRLAIRQALSIAANDYNVRIIEDLVSTDNKTSRIAELLVKIEATGNTLIILPQKDAALELATRNLPNVKVVSARYLNVFDVLNADTIVLSKKALEVVTEWLGQNVASRKEGK